MVFPWFSHGFPIKHLQSQPKSLLLRLHRIGRREPWGEAGHLQSSVMFIRNSGFHEQNGDLLHFYAPKLGLNGTKYGTKYGCSRHVIFLSPFHHSSVGHWVFGKKMNEIRELNQHWKLAKKMDLNSPAALTHPNPTNFKYFWRKDGSMGIVRSWIISHDIICTNNAPNIPRSIESDSTKHFFFTPSENHGLHTMEPDDINSNSHHSSLAAPHDTGPGAVHFMGTPNSS